MNNDIFYTMKISYDDLSKINNAPTCEKDWKLFLNTKDMYYVYEIIDMPWNCEIYFVGFATKKLINKLIKLGFKDTEFSIYRSLLVCIFCKYKENEIELLRGKR